MKSNSYLLNWLGHENCYMIRKRRLPLGKQLKSWRKAIVAYCRQQKKPILGLLILFLILQSWGELNTFLNKPAGSSPKESFHSIILSPIFHFASKTYYYKSKQMAKTIDSILQEENVPLNNTLISKVSLKIARLAHQYKIDPFLILAIMKTESRFDPEARSYAGAMGLMQVLPIVIRDLKKDLPEYSGRPYEDVLYDPMDNLSLGVHYFSELLAQFNNNYNLALTAYNMGPTAVIERLKNHQPLPQDYARKVMRYYRNYQNLDISFIENI